MWALEYQQHTPAAIAALEDTVAIPEFSSRDVQLHYMDSTSSAASHSSFESQTRMLRFNTTSSFGSFQSSQLRTPSSSLSPARRRAYEINPELSNRDDLRSLDTMSQTSFESQTARFHFTRGGSVHSLSNDLFSRTSSIRGNPHLVRTPSIHRQDRREDKKLGEIEKKDLATMLEIRTTSTFKPTYS